MALRDQPYLPLYIQDIMTDEKLNECSAATHGVFIKGIMCLMHKSETYGKILLKQKYKQNSSKEKNFAVMLANHLPYTVDVIEAALTELIDEKVCSYEGDYLVQKRMVKDGETSVKRKNAGSEGGKKTQTKNQKFALAKSEANTEYEYEYKDEIEDSNKYKNEFFLIPEMLKDFKLKNPDYPEDKKNDFPAVKEIAEKISKWKGADQITEVKTGELIREWWGKIITHIRGDGHLCKYSLSQINKHFQSIIQSFINTKHGSNTKPVARNNKEAGANELLEQLREEIGNRA